MKTFSNWLQIWNKYTQNSPETQGIAFGFPNRNDKLPFPDSPNPQGMKIARELASLLIIETRFYLENCHFGCAYKRDVLQNRTR